MYDEMAAERERRVAENWRSDADNTVVVVRRTFRSRLVIVVLSHCRMVYFQFWLLFYWECHTRMPRSFIFLRFLSFSYWPA